MHHNFVVQGLSPFFFMGDTVVRTILAVSLLVLLLLGIVYGATISSLTIRVLKDDKPVVDAVVELWANDTMMYRGTTDANGVVTFSNVTTGDYIIYVYVNGTAYRFDKTIDENTTELNLTLSGLEGVKATAKTWLSNYTFLGGLFAAFVFGILIAYGLSGQRVPRKRR